MSNKPTLNNSQTDWQRLDAITDEDIDLSDCPEVTPEMFAKAVVRHRHSEFEQYLPGSFGTSFFERRLAVRQIIHEELFYNVWDELGSWLASISATTGLVGYYRNLEDDSIEDANLICFEDSQVSELSVEDVQTIDNFLQDLETVLSGLQANNTIPTYYQENQ